MAINWLRELRNEFVAYPPNDAQRFKRELWNERSFSTSWHILSDTANFIAIAKYRSKLNRRTENITKTIRFFFFVPRNFKVSISLFLCYRTSLWFVLIFNDFQIALRRAANQNILLNRFLGFSSIKWKMTTQDLQNLEKSVSIAYPPTALPHTSFWLVLLCIWFKCHAIKCKKIYHYSPRRDAVPIHW